MALVAALALVAGLAACGAPPSPYAAPPPASRAAVRYLAVDSALGVVFATWSQLLYGATATPGSTMFDVFVGNGPDPTGVQKVVGYVRTVRAEVVFVWTPSPFLSSATAASSEPLLGDLVLGLRHAGVRAVLVGNLAAVPGSRFDLAAVDAAIAATVRSSGGVLVDVRKALAGTTGRPLFGGVFGGLTVTGNQLVAGAFYQALRQLPRLDQGGSAPPRAST